jgi:hypothetical protein
MELYKKKRPELLEKIEQLSLKHGLSLFNKIKQETNETNLNSLMTEAHFGIYFDTFSTSIKYNHKYFSQSNATPDFVACVNGQDIVFEVLRVNPAMTDAEIQVAEELAMNNFISENPGIPVMGGFHMITQRPNKLIGENGSIIIKALKYGPLVGKANNPIILCVYLDLISGHNAHDLYQTLYGSSARLMSDFGIDDLYPNSPFHLIGDGLFYNNKQMQENVSGVLLRDNDAQFIYFHNFSSRNRLNTGNKELFISLQHPYR